MKAVCEDGRVRGPLQFYGASNRQMGGLVQVQNFHKIRLMIFQWHVKLYVKIETLEMLYDTLFVTVMAFVAPSGKTCN